MLSKEPEVFKVSLPFGPFRFRPFFFSLGTVGKGEIEPDPVSDPRDGAREEMNGVVSAMNPNA